jgi:hypothetical protein
VRLSFLAILGAVIPAASISLSWFSSAAVQRRPAGLGPVISPSAQSYDPRPIITALKESPSFLTRVGRLRLTGPAYPIDRASAPLSRFLRRSLIANLILISITHPIAASVRNLRSVFSGAVNANTGYATGSTSGSDEYLFTSLRVSQLPRQRGLSHFPI